MSTQQTVIDTNALSRDHAAKGPLVKERGRETASTLTACKASAPDPQWSEVYNQHYGATAEGYGYLVANSGQLTGQGVRLTRSSFEPVNPGTEWVLDSRINLASVSKPITAVAVLKLFDAIMRSPLPSRFTPISLRRLRSSEKESRPSHSRTSWP